MAKRTWGRPVGADAEAHVSLESSESDARITYRIQFPFLVGDQSADDLQVTGGGTIDDHQLRSDGGMPVSDLLVSLPADVDVERLIVRSRPERIVIHLPSPRLLEWCDRALDGDESSAEALIESFESPVQIPLVCGSFLGPSETVRLIQALVRHDRFVQSMLHSYRYAIVRSALVSRTGLHVGTYREFTTLVDGLDAIEEIGTVNLVDALADVIETVHDTPADTVALLESLGIDLETLHDRDDGLFTACFLAHIAVSDGVEAALAYEVPRKLPPRGHYDRRKRAVFRADYGARGTAWRRLLNAARRQSADEVGYVLAYTLYWTGEESRSDSRMGELLLRGAELAAAHAGLRKIEYRARYKRLLAAGHRLRGAHCWAPSVANFEAARELATTRPFLDVWEPILASGLVYSRQLSLDGELDRAVGVLDETLAAFLAAEPPTAVANRSVRHLRAQKCEIESLRYQDDDPDRTRDLLEEAREYYEAIGFDRSRAKIDRQLAALPEAAAPEGGVPSPREAATTPVGVEHPVAEPAMDEFEPAAPEALDDDWLEHIDYPDEESMAEEYDARFDDPYQF